MSTGCTPPTSGSPRAPDFALPDHLGATFRLADHVARGPLLVVFFRGHWCPYCRRYLGKLRDHHARLRDRGAEFRLRDPLAAGATPVVVVFFRGHWCPYCRRYLAKLQAHWPRFAERRVRVVAISPEPPATSRMLVEQLGLAFPVLADTAGTVIDAYGTRNGFGSARVLLPHPSVFVVEGDGRVRFRSVDRNYKKRTTMRTIFAALDDVAAAPHA